MKKLVKVALVDDEVRISDQLLRLFRSSAPRFELTAHIRDLATAEKQIADLSPDVLLMDILFSKGSGVDCVRRISGKIPDTSILMLTVSSSPTHIFDALRAGAHGYLIKRDLEKKLIPAIESVLQGDSELSPSIARKIVDYFRHQGENEKVTILLTARETDVLRAIASGAAVKEVATNLGIADETVGKHLGNIYKKLHVNSRRAAVLKFRSL